MTADFEMKQESKVRPMRLSNIRPFYKSAKKVSEKLEIDLALLKRLMNPNIQLNKIF